MLKFLSYIKSILGVPFIIVWTLFWSISAVVTSVTGSRKVGDFIISNWAKGLIIFFNIKVNISGQDNLPNQGAIYLFNHVSHFDIPVLTIALISRSIRFGAKAELFKIPFFGAAMNAVGMLKIHRGSRDKVLKLYQKSLKNTEKGYSYILAPEGTRGSGEELQKFKSGPFIMAISGGLDLVPVTLKGLNQVLPKNSYMPCWGVWSCEIDVKIHPPVSTKGQELDHRQALAEKVHQTMAQSLY